jgi:recombination protein RecA
LYGEGISRQGEIIDLGVEFDIVAKSGSWYSYDGHRIGQGKENVREYLKNNNEMAMEIESKIRKKLGIPEVNSINDPLENKSKKEESAVNDS